MRSIIASAELAGAALPQPVRETVEETIPQISFAEIYAKTADPVYRFCLSQLRDPALAEDVAADVFASAWSAFPTAGLAGGLGGGRSWIFRIARNAVVDQYRRQASRRSLLDRLRHSAGNIDDVEKLASIRADLRAVLSALTTLSSRQRTLVGLRIAAGLSFAEIAGVTGMSESAAKMATHRALGQVRAHVGRTGFVTPGR